MLYSEDFQTILNRMNNGELQKPIFDLTSVDSNAYSLMGHWKTAARKAGWSKENIDIVLEECTAGNYDHLVATLLEVSASEPDEDEDEDEDLWVDGDPDMEQLLKDFNKTYPYIHGLTLEMIDMALEDYIGSKADVLDTIRDYVLSEGLCEVTE